MEKKKWDGVKVLGIFDMICGSILLFMVLGSQFSLLLCGLLGVLYIYSGNGVLKRRARACKIFLNGVIPLSILASINVMFLTNEKFPDYFRMDIAEVLQFIGIFILFPLVLNFYFLTRPKVKEQFA